LVGRRHAAPAFRPSAPSQPGRAPSAVQTTALLAVLVLVAAGIAAVSFLVKPSKARSFDLFLGSVYINDNRSPVSIDLASGKPTVRLRNVFTAVSAGKTGAVRVVPLGGGNTLMLNTTTGEFNMIDDTGFVVKTSGGGVTLPTTTVAASAVPSGRNAYILASTGSADGDLVYLVNEFTVASALGPKAQAKARAAGRLLSTVSTVPSPAAAAGGNLWVLTDPPGGAAGPAPIRTITELSVPRGSDTGVILRQRRQGAVTGAAAVEAAASKADGSGREVAAVASADGVDVFGRGARKRLGLNLPPVNQILAVQNSAGRFMFLYDTSSGWYRVTASIDGTGSASAVLIRAIAADATLGTAAASLGRLYTMDSTSGQMWQIDGAGTAAAAGGVSRYPIVTGESANFGRAEIVARGGRVIFNAPNMQDAVVLFTDGSRRPRVIDKQSAVQLDPSGATSLADAHAQSNRQPGKTRKPPKPVTRPAQTVDDKVNCTRTTQIPHIPTVQLTERGSRSIGLQWTYPILSPDDCNPTTYQVTTKVDTGGAPAGPAPIPVNGQNSTTVGGLFPNTTYEFTVAAFINGRSTSSRPLKVTTDTEGPSAPTNVHTTVDDNGNWTVAWTSCAGQSGCIPVDQWEIQPRFCDGIGLSSAPAAIAQPGDPTTRNWSITYPGSDALLGRGLSFTVAGRGSGTGILGTQASDNSCSFSWAHPVAADIHVQASTPAQTATSQATTNTTVRVSFDKGAVHDLGGLRGQLSYDLVSGGSVVTRAGPTTATTVSLTGITAGRRFQVVVHVNPPRHPEAAITLPAVDVVPAIANWPTPTVDASFADSDASTGALTVTVGLGGADTRGERFSLTSDSALLCSNARLPLSQSGIVPGQSFTVSGIDRFQFRQACSVTVQLVQDGATATDPPLYGAGASAHASSASFQIDDPSSVTTAADFDAHWIADSLLTNPQIAVSYNGNDRLEHSSNWSMVVHDGAGDVCSDVVHDVPTSPVTITVAKSCVGAVNWSVDISFQYFAQQKAFTGANAINVSGTAPQPIDPTQIDFTASWNADPANPAVVVHYTGPYDQPALATLNWTETVTSNGVQCGQAHTVPSHAADITVSVDLTACPPGTAGPGGSGPPAPNTYTVTIHEDDPNFGGSHDWQPEITGAPPQ
jgi:hypothetical protein